MDPTLNPKLAYSNTPRHRLCLGGLLLLFAVVIYRLPHSGTEAMAVHKAIVDALVAGNNWGRQALVGSMDYPVLPSLSLLAAELLAELLRLDGQRLLLAIVQSWSVGYLFRITLRRRGWLAAPLAIAFAVILPQIRNSFLLLDPNWVTAVPLAAAFFHLMLWHEERGLRDLIMIGVHCGMLSLCGFGPALIGVGMLIVVYLEIRRINASQETDAKTKKSAGLRSLLWAPFAYGAFLWLLWNWLVMDDMFFGLRDAWLRADYVLIGDLCKHASQAFPITLTLLIPLIILILNSDQKMVARCLLPPVILIPIAAMTAAALGVPQTGLIPLAAILLLAVFILVFLAKFNTQQNKIATGVVCFAIISFCFSQPLPPDAEPVAEAQAPSRQEILDFIDQYWPESRTVLYGVKLPAVYPDPKEKRFVARLDYQEADFLEQAQDEQLHILVPPADGVYYPLVGSPLADIHANGKPWLLLEKQWPSQWQLWRCVIPAKNESRLDFLR
ncbi:MAG TPA: hypothetical protein PKY10_08880 [Lentisphaeria bacterium]|nr:hypothetical protein [Lentisphaeria bacterium]